ncbi:unnamed protein product, partial [Echinostoma caproni]|uniref:SHR-BD domain-containing protein n=1 Tax=Echinostoma caproni TaxID=27848 RepID=A0A183AVB9_9TREM
MTLSPNLSTVRAIGCVHHLIIQLQWGSGRKITSPIATLSSARADLVPMVHCAQPASSSGSASSWRSTTPQTSPSAVNALFRSNLSTPTSKSTPAGFRYPKPVVQTDRLVLSCQTTTVRLTLSRKNYDILLSVISAISRQLDRLGSREITTERSTKMEFSATGVEDLDEESLPDFILPSYTDPVSKLLQILNWPESFSRAISTDLNLFEFNSRLVLSLFEITSDGLIPLFKLRADQFTMSWRQLTNQSGAAVCSGLSISYFNRDLVCWEPALEPWTCSLEWNPTVNNGFSRITSLFFSSSDPLNINLTIPLVSLIRALCEPTKAKECVEETINKSSSNGVIGQSQLRLSNQTGSTIWYCLVQPDAPTGVMTSSSPSDSTTQIWQKVEKDSDPIDIPCAECPLLSHNADNAPAGIQSGTSPASNSPAENFCLLHLSHQLPRLAIQVAGWKAALPISVDRPGVFFRTLERQEALEIDVDDPAWAIQCNLPSHTRLVVEVVRIGSLQHLVILRSGLTVTNDLPIGHTLFVAMQLSPFVTEVNNPADDAWSSQLVLLESNNLSGSIDQRVPLLSLESGQTSSIPLNLTAAASVGLGFLTFCPAGRIVPISTATPLLQRPSGSRTAPRGSGGYSWASVHVPHTLPEYAMDSSIRDLVEAILMSHAFVSVGQPGLLDIPVMNREERKDSSQQETSVRTASHLSTHGSSSSFGSSAARRPSTALPYYMCLALVRDRFPPDPIWVGLYNSLDTNRYTHPRQLPGHHFTIGPAVRITNLLPYEMTYFFAGTSVYGVIPVGENACVLEVQVLSRAGGPRHLTVSAVIWLVNESGLPLVFAQSPTSTSSQSHSKTQKSLANISAGQYEEHEQARSVAPLLFCFAKKNEGHLLKVRVGRGASTKRWRANEARKTDKSGVEPSSLCPVWSPGISLEKPGVDMLQLKIVDRSNRY